VPFSVMISFEDEMKARGVIKSDPPPVVLLPAPSTRPKARAKKPTPVIEDPEDIEMATLSVESPPPPATQSSVKGKGKARQREVVASSVSTQAGKSESIARGPSIRRKRQRVDSAEESELVDEQADGTVVDYKGDLGGISVDERTPVDFGMVPALKGQVRAPRNLGLRDSGSPLADL
jgi:hypothetical protein